MICWLRDKRNVGWQKYKPNVGKVATCEMYKTVADYQIFDSI